MAGRGAGNFPTNGTRIIYRFVAYLADIAVARPNELPGNEDGFVELTEEECRQLELPKEWIA